MVRKIDRDANRFKQIVRGKIKSDLRKYITHGELIGKTGGEFVSIPLPQIEIPEFRYGTKNRGGVGQGPGDIGTPIGRSNDGEAGTGAGDAPGHHILEVELTMDDLAAILGEELALPRIAPKGRANIVEDKDKYTGIRQAGPESLRHFKRTYKKALKRQIASNTYDPKEPLVIPIREDKLYRSWNPIALPQFNAVVFNLMDVSGSMTDDQKEIVRAEAFWIDAWLKSQYDGVTTRYIIHDAVVARSTSTPSTIPAKAAARGSARLTTCATRSSTTNIRRSTGTFTCSTSPTATTGARTTASASACFAISSFRNATYSATAKSKAPTARASSTASSKKHSRMKKTWPCRRSATRKAFTTRSRSSWDGENDFHLCWKARTRMRTARAISLGMDDHVCIGSLGQ